MAKTTTIKKRRQYSYFSILELQEKYTVSIAGEVINVGTIDYIDSMKLQDLIILAGGFKEGASGKKLIFPEESEVICLMKKTVLNMPL